MSSESPALGRRPVRVTWLRTLHSEWTKFYSLRSSYWTLLIALGMLVGLSTLITIVSASESDVTDMLDRLAAARNSLAATAPALVEELERQVRQLLLSLSLAGWWLSQLAIGVLGVIAVTGEYSTGMIRASFAAVPRRLPVVFGKAVLMALVILAVMTPAAFIAFTIGESVLSSRGFDVKLSDPGVARGIIGVALYLTGIGVIGVAFGWLLRSAAGAIAVLVGILVLLPFVFRLIPVDWVQEAARFLPSNSGQALFTLDTSLGDGPFAAGLPPWTGFGVFVGWTALALAGAAYVTKRRDA